jgi:two-component system, cell cycle response regulator
MLRKVLLIDDDRIQHRITQAFFASFRAERFELVTKDNYDDGLRALLTHEFAACLLDYQLGPRDGLELIREAIGNGSRTPIIFLTAETGQNVDIDAMNAGALDYLVKGEINVAALERSLRYALKLAESLEALRQLATRDELTGLLNRREFDRLVKEEDERARRFGRPLSLALLDVDHFKRVNDTWGHAAGDAALRHLGRILLSQARSVDRVARYGGEEFAILFPETSPAEAAVAMARILQAIAASEIEWGEKSRLRLTASAGVAGFRSGDPGGHDVLGLADEQLYQAKAKGRNRVCAAPSD